MKDWSWSNFLNAKGTPISFEKTDLYLQQLKAVNKAYTIFIQNFSKLTVVWREVY
jgi:hypothetical protein